ncbi:MAG: hypothetical protein EBR40_11795 [Proteobacteria bacterium]|nr:hypothetical protein [Pseudomonadota bacterium]
MNQELADMLGQPEELHPDLQECVSEDHFVMLRHRLLYMVPFSDALSGYANKLYAQKLELLAKAEAIGDFHTYVWLHERPYRVDAFCDIMHLLNGQEYWELLASVWMDSENIRENFEVLEILLRNPKPDREYFMTPEDREVLASLPDTVTVYQGHTLDRDDGWSWTTDEATAVWFARRFGMLEDATPVVSVGFVPKPAITAYLGGRNESEIVVDPDEVTITRVYAPGEPS